MKQLGETLKQSRIDQKKSITDISNITKMNINIIQNLEDGNVEYFSNDLTYLKYYVRSYISALGIEIDDVEHTVNNIALEYTQSINVIEQEKLDEMNENIHTRAKTISVNKQSVKKPFKVDWTLISLITIVGIIGMFLIYSVVANVFNGSKNETPTPPPVIDTPQDDEEETPEIPEEIIKEKVEIVNTDDNNLIINNWDHDTTFETKFNVDTWVQISINGQVVLLPHEQVTNKVFVPNEDLILTDFYIMNGEEIPFKEGDIISIRYGVIKGNEILINDEKVQLAPAIAEAQGGTNIIYTLGKQVSE